MQDVVGQARCLMLGLEAHLKHNIDPALPVVKWLLRHAAFLLTRFSVGHDGLTAWRRLIGRNHAGVIVEFGERVFGKLALKRPPSTRKAKKGRKKLAARSVEGIWVGVYPRTGEHIVIRHDGAAIRVRTVHRVVPQERWNIEMIKAIKSTPRQPNPVIDAGEGVKGQLATDEPPAEREGGADLPEPKTEADGGPRELRITDRLLEKFEYTPGCPGCIHKQLDLEGHRGHSAACRQRIYDLMRQDADELDRLTAAERRLGRQPAEHEKIRRPTAPDAPVAAAEPEPPPPAPAVPEPPARGGGQSSRQRGSDGSQR